MVKFAICGIYTFCFSFYYPFQHCKYIPLQISPDKSLKISAQPGYLNKTIWVIISEDEQNW